MTNGWPETAFEESALLGKLGVYLTLGILLDCHVPLGFDPQIPVNLALRHFLLSIRVAKLFPA